MIVTRDGASGGKGAAGGIVVHMVVWMVACLYGWWRYARGTRVPWAVWAHGGVEEKMGARSPERVHTQAPDSDRGPTTAHSL